MLGLGGLAYFAGFSPIINWWKVGNVWSLSRTEGGTISGKAAWDAGYFEPSSGELLNPLPSDVTIAERLVLLPTVQSQHLYNSSQWTIEWDGRGATCAIANIGSGGSQSINSSTGAGTFTLGTDQGNFRVQFTITDHSDPPHNVRVYLTAHAANVAAGEMFHPNWLEQVSPFAVLRLMDWMGTNGSDIIDFEDFATADNVAWGQTLNATSGYGPQGGVPLSVIAALAEQTGATLQFCIPHQATDACVQAIAEYFRDNISTPVIWEYTNEHWNNGFAQFTYCQTQGESIWPEDSARHNKWYGYRAAQCMAIIRDAYNNRSRWKGCLGTQTVSSTGVIDNVLIGVEHFIDTEAEGLAINDLFDYVAVTGYFGDTIGCTRLTSVSQDNPAVVGRVNHGFTNGQTLRFFVFSGMVELDNVEVTVANATTDTFELQGVDTTEFGEWDNTTTRNYVAPGPLFKLMDDSETADPENPYDLFSRVMSDSWITGTGTWEGGSIATSFSLSGSESARWPNHKAVAEEHGLQLIQYEGGCHFVGDVSLNGFGGNPRFTEFMSGAGHSEHVAEVYRRMYSSFLRLGGILPAKFVEAGSPSQFGTWGGMRFIPGDEDNPVWAVTRHMNESPTPIRFRINLA